MSSRCIDIRLTVFYDGTQFYINEDTLRDLFIPDIFEIIWEYIFQDPLDYFMDEIDAVGIEDSVCLEVNKKKHYNQKSYGPYRKQEYLITFHSVLDIDEVVDQIKILQDRYPELEFLLKYDDDNKREIGLFTKSNGLRKIFYDFQKGYF